ncbi:uncharacterized protein STEHIDRAFT_111350 [Stereum hirsutum FP-91666 SS1]|uniref:uncharacterized protein n=1 Tax=Stereum hirsutum (strain FP-91666) TaxID=721885 RepID=UPI000444A932|nr:uncharacterized protein STEHIDRAFT_111350 [Stereum hirsutum FP-91666 SS1]EIM86964.1 hypothetical protein STEHIDRAFT_111350 [Stereum hirsutum FP-91666 SS1]
MHDNDPKLTAKLTSRWLASQKLSVMPWPANSPDMNPAEHVWDRIKMRVGALRLHPRNLDELWEAVQWEWGKLDPEFVESLYESMPLCMHKLECRNSDGSEKGRNKVMIRILFNLTYSFNRASVLFTNPYPSFVKDVLP